MNVLADVKEVMTRRGRLLAPAAGKPLSLKANLAWTFASNDAQSVSVQNKAGSICQNLWLPILPLASFLTRVLLPLAAGVNSLAALIRE